MITSLIVYYIITTLFLLLFYNNSIYNKILEDIHKDYGDSHPLFLNPYGIRDIMSILLIILPFSLYVVIIIGIIEKIKNPNS